MNINFVKDIFKNGKDIDPNIYKDLLTKQIILRDYLAIERTILTNESTFLAYIRTSLTVMAAGATLANLFQNNTFLYILGILLAVSGFLILILGADKTICMRKKINKFLNKRTELESNHNL